MHDRSFGTTVLSGVMGLASLTAAPTVQAQARFAAESSPRRLSATSLLTALSNYRAIRWASAGSVIHCTPAPLTERPGAQAEFVRPHVAPLEEAFADAKSVKQAIEYRAHAVAIESR
jgi:hypothetical protein